MGKIYRDLITDEIVELDDDDIDTELGYGPVVEFDPWFGAQDPAFLEEKRLDAMERNGSLTDYVHPKSHILKYFH
jgi:hypothetical protein